MNAKQQKFADEYMIDMNAEQAAIRAGYSPASARGSAHKLTKHPEIKAYIQKRLDEQQEETIAKADEVMRYLSSVMRGESSAHVLAMRETGAQEVITKPPDEREKLKAAELLGKRYSMFTDKTEVSGAVPVVISGADELED